MKDSSENFTKIPNEYLEALARIRIPGRATQVLHVIWRKTWGYHKQSDKISLGQFKKYTGIRQTHHIIRSINKLLAMNLICKNTDEYISQYSINGDIETWLKLSEVVPKKVVPKKVVPKKVVPKKVVPKKVQTTTKKGTETTTIFGTHKRKKENIQKKYCESFSLFWECYPLKESKFAASKAWGKLKPSNGDIEIIMAALENHKRIWQAKDKQYIPHAATWLNNKRWEDELTEETIPFDDIRRFKNDIS